MEFRLHLFWASSVVYGEKGCSSKLLNTKIRWTGQNLLKWCQDQLYHLTGCISLLCHLHSVLFRN